MTRKSDNGKPPNLKGGNGRNPDGTFAKGWKGGPGRKRGARTEHMIDAFDRLLTQPKADEIMGKLIEEAVNGAPWAIKEVLDRCLGKANQKIEVDLEVDLASEVRDGLKAILARPDVANRLEDEALRR